MFALGTFRNSESKVFVGICIDNRILALDSVATAWSRGRRTRLRLPSTIFELLEAWEASFEKLQDLADFAAKEAGYLASVGPDGLHYLPPIQRPGKILHSAANFREHVAEMTEYNVAAGAADPSKRFVGDKTGARPYLFLKAASALNGAFDDIVLPDGEHQIDWEAELAAVVGRPGRSVLANQALTHVAGYMVTNDISCRDMLWREDRPNFRTDWLACKSHDGFAPMGPLFIPSEFAGNPGDMHITLKVNDFLKQEGSTSGMIFSLEEQIEYASRFMTLHPGDIFVTGTIGGVGQGRGEFLKPGDQVETQIRGVGLMKNRVVRRSIER